MNIDLTKLNRVELEELQKQVQERIEDIDCKHIDNPYGWSEEERTNFFDILWTWVGVNDHTYDLYEYLREAELGDEYAPPYDEYMAEFFRLFKKEINDYLAGVDFYEEHFQKNRAEYQEYKRQRETQAS